MSLVPVDEGLLAPVLAAFDSDPEGTAALLELATFEALGRELDRVRPQLEAELSKAALSDAAAVRRALVRGYIAKRMEGEEPEGYLQAAAHLTAVEAHFAKYRLPWDPKRHPRDQNTGRFTHVLSSTSDSGRRQEAQQTVNTFRDTGYVQDGKTVRVHGHDASGARLQPVDVDLRKPLRSQLPGEMVPSHLTVAPGDVQGREGNQAAAMDTLAGFVGGPRASRVTEGAPLERGQFGDALRSVTSGENARYNRVSLAGHALSRMSNEGSPGDILGSFARLVGDLGPEAEEVLKPGLRRTAYRYRGTEKRPSKDVVAEVGNVTNIYSQLSSSKKVPDPNNPQEQTTEGQLAEARLNALRTAQRSTRRAGTPDGAARDLLPPDAGVASYYAEHRQGRSRDELALRLRGDTAVAYLLNKIPSTKQTELSVAAGRLPPSQGVIIDADGDVVSEAMGAGGDHYLPFDLRNLKRLGGGQYARTRAMGGPSVEDIYTGLMSGARQVQVASNSGVFTLEFDPELRGGRRYSDKARSMVERYRRLLDAVENADLYQTDVSPARQRELRQQALDYAGPEDWKDRFNTLLRRERVSSGFISQEDIDRKVEELTGNEAGVPSASRRADIVREAEDAVRDEKVRPYRLNGEGYYAAMRSLQEEFPYFIRGVDYRPLRDFADQMQQPTPLDPTTGGPRPGRNGPRDRGYVPYGEHDPAAARPSAFHRPAQASDDAAAPARTAPTAERTATTSSGGQQPKAAAGLSLPNEIEVKLAENTKPLEQALPAAKGALEDTLARSLNPAMLRALDNPGVIQDHLYVDDFGDKAHYSPTEALQLKSFAYGRWLMGDKRLSGPLGARNAAKFLLSDEATPEHHDKAAKALDDLGEFLSTELATEEQGRFPAAERQEAADALAAAKMVTGAPFGAPVAPPDYALGHVLDEKDPKPLPFAEITRLGNKIENYDRYIAAADTKDRALAGKIRAFDADPAKAQEALADQARSYKRVLDWAGKYSADAEAPDVDELPTGVTMSQARELATEPRSSELYADLVRGQRAWSYVAARRAATALAGDAGKAQAPVPGPSSPQQIEAAQSNGQLAIEAAKPEEQAKRAQPDLGRARLVAKALLAQWVADESSTSPARPSTLTTPRPRRRG